MMFAFYMLSLVIGVFLGLILPYYLTKLYTYYEKSALISPLIPSKVNEERMCQERHEWIEAISVDESLEYKPLTICKKCGFIPSKSLMATEEGLKKIIENIAVRKIEESIKREFEDLETEDLTKLVEEFKVDTSFEKAVQLYSAGQTVNKRYIMYKIARSEELKQESKDGV